MSSGVRSPSFVELFCADGYYAFIAKSLGCKPIAGVDNNREGHSDQVTEISLRLGIRDFTFIKDDIINLGTDTKYNIVANVGGLYHCDDPKLVLQKSFELAENFVIVQNVVNAAESSDNYFEAPAPGWTWGNRFSRQSFDRLVRTEFGKNVVYSHFNHLLGNSRPEDLGSSYYLLKK